MIVMVKNNIKSKQKFLGDRTLQPSGHSTVVPIPPEGLKFLGLEEGDKVVVYLDREENEIRIIPGKSSYVRRKGHNKKIGFELSLPKKLFKKLMGK